MATYSTPYPHARKRADKPLATPALDTMVNREFITNYLADRLTVPYGELRPFRDRIGKKIDTARTTGKLQSTDGKYQFADFAAWARSRKEFAAAVADIVLPNTGSATAILPAMFGQAFGYSLPPTLEGCKTALVEAYRELNQLRGDNQSLRAAVTALTPYKEKADARSLAASIAGQRGKRLPRR